MEPLRNLNFSRYKPSQKVRLVSMLVQLLHSHTFEQEVNLNKFIDNYRQKTGLRKQLSQALRTFLKNSFEDSLEIHDTLEVLRSFVEKLYEQRSDTGIDYPNDELKKVSRRTFSSKPQKKIIKMLGGAFVIVDVILAIHRFGDNDSQRRTDLLRSAYKSFDRCVWTKEIELKTFLLSNKPFMSVTETLMHAQVQVLQVQVGEVQPGQIQVGQVRSSAKLLAAIGWLFRRIFCFSPAPRNGLEERCEIVEPMLRTAMGLSFDDHYDILANLLWPLRNCIVGSVENRNQLCSVDGWANFLLGQLERLIDEKQKRESINLFLIELTDLLRILMNRLSPDEKERFEVLYSTPKICQVLVKTLDNRKYGGISLKIIYTLIENRSFVRQLKECEIVPALQKYRSSIENQLNVEVQLRRIGDILKMVDETFRIHYF